MVVLGIFVIAGFLAYKGMMAGVFPVLSRCLMGALAIATGVGFAGPLRRQIPYDSALLYGAGIVVITVAAYLVQRLIVELYFPERQITLPELVDRLGGAIFGFFGGLMVLGWACMAVVLFPLPEAVGGLQDGLRRGAQYGVAAAKVVSTVAGTGETITLQAIEPHEPPPPEPPATGPSDSEEAGADEPTSDNAAAPAAVEPYRDIRRDWAPRDPLRNTNR